MMAAQILASVESEHRKNMGLLLDLKGEKAHQICSFMWADNFWIMSYSKRALEQMLRDLIEEAETWNVAPKPASLWWTSSYEEEERSEVLVATTQLMYKFPYEEKFCKGNVSCTSYSRTFTIHKWLRQTAYILTHNMNMLEHIANNGTNTTKHTDVYNAQF